MLLTLSIGAGNLMAQNQGRDQDNGHYKERKMTKQERKAEREKRREAEAAKEQYLYEKAMQALKNQSFIIRVDQLIFPRGRVQFVTERTNFIYMNDNKAVIQIAISNFSPGQNGVGGVTVEGRPSNISMRTDKKGFTFYEFTDNGAVVSANVVIQVVPGSNRVEATIYPNYNNRKLTLSGTLIPFDASMIFQGQTI